MRSPSRDAVLGTSPSRDAVLGTSHAGGAGRTGVDAPDAAPAGRTGVDAPDAAPNRGSIGNGAEAPNGAVLGTCMLGPNVGCGLHAPAASLASSSSTSAVPGERHACG